MAGKSKRNNEDNIPEGLDDLLNELTGNKNNKEDSIPEGLDDLLNEIKGKKKTATKPKRKRGRPRKKKTSPPGALTKYSKTEDVDSRILELLGLEYTFDLDYDDYANLLKEKLIEVSRGTDDSSTEDAMLLREELKKARGNKGKGTFEVKKKISKDSFTNFNVGGPKKDTTQTRKPAYGLLQGKNIAEKSQRVNDLKENQKEEKKGRKQSDNQILKSISKSLDRIIGILSKQLKFDKNQAEKQRKLEESGKRKDKENKMESAFSKGIKALAKVAGKIFSPLQEFFGKIIRFFTVIFLGKVVKKFLKWFTDPKNESKMESIGRLLQTFWPAILAGLVFLSPLGGIIAKAVSVIGKGVAKLLTVAIPSLLKFGMKNPVAATALAAAGLLTGGATIPKLIPGTVDEQERKTEKQINENGEDKVRNELERKANEPNFYERLTGQDSEAKEQLYKLDTGETKRYKLGGKITAESGQKIKGAGVDTQLIAARPGEIVINKETVNAVGSDYFLGLNKEYGGPNANKPKTAKVEAASGGGLILPAFANGGMIGGEGPEESKVQKPRKPSKPEDKKIGLDSNVIKWVKGNPSRAKELNSNQFSYGTNKRIAAYDKKNVQSNIQYTRNDNTISVNRFNVVEGMMGAVKEGGVKGGLNYILSGLKNMFGGLSDADNNLNQQKLMGLKSSNASKTYTPFSGLVKENSGMNIPGGGTDRQRIDVQPGEYVLPVDKVMKMGGPGKLDRIVADLDSNSTPARMGLRNKDISEGIAPYNTQGSGEIDIETLPLSGLGGGNSPVLNSGGGTQDEFFSPISSAGLSERQRFMDTIGISAFT